MWEIGFIKLSPESILTGVPFCQFSQSIDGLIPTPALNSLQGVFKVTDCMGSWLYPLSHSWDPFLSRQVEFVQARTSNRDGAKIWPSVSAVCVCDASAPPRNLGEEDTWVKNGGLTPGRPVGQKLRELILGHWGAPLVGLLGGPFTVGLGGTSLHRWLVPRSWLAQWLIPSVISALTHSRVLS